MQALNAIFHVRIPELIYKSHSDQTLQNIYTVTNDQDGNKELKLVVINCEYNIILISIILINSRESITEFIKFIANNTPGEMRRNRSLLQAFT